MFFLIMFKVIVAGTRTFDNYELLKEKLDFYLQARSPVMIISGGAAGADKLGERYARENKCSIMQMDANWQAYGKGTGPKRNEQMAQKADACIVFWNGQSRDTLNMIENARKYSLALKIVRY